MAPASPTAGGLLLSTAHQARRRALPGAARAGPLDGDRGVDGPYHGGETGEHPVTGVLHLVPAETLQCFVDDRIVMANQRDCSLVAPAGADCS